ncbi:MAG: RidA family protein [Myxococcales bacterium]|nr:RidA family protein [Myxococcales bacterium]MBL0193561.1 RidA family protein [Myxococcales bacterium]HQY64926.1 RidA family protein [Polyangiaceae bacterium]
MEAIATTSAPGAIGPYSQAVRAGDLVFLSGQIPLDPATGQLVSGTIAEETERVMANLEAVLAAAGLTFANVVRTTIFLSSMDHFAEVNAVYGKRFSGVMPARATVAVSGLPRGARVEIDAIARG